MNEKAIAAAREIKRDAKRFSGIRFTPRGRLFVATFRVAIQAIDRSFRACACLRRAAAYLFKTSARSTVKRGFYGVYLITNHSLYWVLNNIPKHEKIALTSTVIIFAFR